MASAWVEFAATTADATTKPKSKLGEIQATGAVATRVSEASVEGVDFSNVVLWRAVERLTGVLIGGGSIYLGYRLFMALPRRKSDSEGKFDLPGGISIYVSRVGPGVFFALFGTALVGLSFVNAVSWEPSKPGVAQSVAEEHQQMAKFSYASGEIGSAQVRLERDTIARDLRTLRKLEVALQRHAAGDPMDLGQSDTASVLIGLPRIKRMMLYGVWDEAWGDYQAFAEWVRAGALDPPPEGLADLVTDAFKTGD